MSDSEIPWTVAGQTPLSSTISRSLLNFMSIELVILSNHLILCSPLLPLPSIFPSIRVFSKESALPIRWPISLELRHQYFQCIFRVDFLYDWLVWSPCSPRDSQESSPAPQFKSINSLVLSLLYGPTLISLHDFWKNHRFSLVIYFIHCINNVYVSIPKPFLFLLSKGLSRIYSSTTIQKY